MAQETIYDVLVTDIRDVAQSGLNVRQREPDLFIVGLANSINRHGLLQTIVLRGTYGSPPYDLIVGQRRLLAHKYLRKRYIRARFRPANYGRFKARVDSLVENLQRVKLNHADAAEAIAEVYRHYSKSVRRVAEEIGCSESMVRDYLAIDEQASAKAKKLLKQGIVTKLDVKRVIKAAQGNMSKADRLLDNLPTLTKYDKERMVEYGRKNPKANVDKILNESKKPRMENVVMLELPAEADKALEKAAHELEMDKESVAREAVCSWLKEQGFFLD